jgi:L-lysine 2,3-aminomutase
MADLNVEYYQKLRERINGVNSCQALQDVASEALAALADQQRVIQEQIAAIQPILALLTPPSVNLGAIVTWIKDLITHLITPQIKPYYVYQAQLVELSVQVAQVMDAINNAKLKFPNCTITPPSP